jgi:hypothetical protein
MKVQVLYKIFLCVNNINTGTIRIFEVIVEKFDVGGVLSEKKGGEDDDNDKSSDDKSNNHRQNI